MAVLHADIDAFFASVEQRLDPSLAGRPVIVGSGVIASCSYEARSFGLHAGMPLRKARSLCPEGVFLEGRRHVYGCFAERVFDALLELVPSAETSLDEAFCDLAGTERLFGDFRRLGDLVRLRVLEATGLSVTVGIGPNRMGAKIAGRTVKPGGVRRIRTESELASLMGPLPVSVIPGVGRKVGGVLSGLNVGTVADLRALPEAALVALFGAAGRALFARARGRDARSAAPAATPKRISRETTFHAETSDASEIEGMLQYLCGRAARALRKAGLSARTLSVRIGYADHRREAASRSFPEPCDRDDAMFRAALERLRALYTRRANLIHVGVALSGFVPRREVFQADLFGGEGGMRRVRLGAALDSIRDRFGHAAVIDGRSVNLLGRLRRDGHGYVLRTPCLTK